MSFIRGRQGGPASFFPPVFHHEENGQILVKQIDKEILSKGGWTTIIFRFQEFQPETGDYGPDRYVIQRYQKRGGEYKRQSKFKISSADQARKIIDALGRWVAETGQEQSCK